MCGRDTNVPDAALTAVLPVPTATSAQLQQLFGAKGFSARELVALSGAHAIGSSQFTAPVVRADASDQLSQCAHIVVLTLERMSRSGEHRKCIVHPMVNVNSPVGQRHGSGIVSPCDACGHTATAFLSQP